MSVLHTHFLIQSVSLPSILALQVYSSGNDLVIVDGHLTHVQTVQGDVPIRALHCSEGVGKIAVAWETDVVIFNPEPHEESSETSSIDLSATLTSVVSM